MIFQIYSIFSNREIAIGFWLVVLAIWAFWKIDAASTVRDLVLTLFQGSLFPIFATLAVWVALTVVILKPVGLWTPSETKATVFWYLFSGVVLLGRSISNKDGATFFKNVILDNFKIIAFLEFMVVAYSFSLITELWFIPLMAVLSIFHAQSGTDKKHATVQKILEFILSGIVIFLVVHFAMTTFENNGAIFSLTTLREVLLPILLSILALPYFYLVYCYSSWQSTRISINQKNYQSNELKALARKRIFWSLFLSPKLARRAVRQFQMIPAETHQDVRDIIRDVKLYERKRNTPPTVELEEGWGSYAAEDFLKDHDLKTDDYHELGFGDEWGAASETKYFENAGLYESVISRLKGDVKAVGTLQLWGSFKLDPTPENGLNQFRDICTALTVAATNLNQLPDAVTKALVVPEDITHRNGVHLLNVKTSQFEGSPILDVEFTISMASTSENTSQ